MRRGKRAVPFLFLLALLLAPSCRDGGGSGAHPLFAWPALMSPGAPNWVESSRVMADIDGDGDLDIATVDGFLALRILYQHAPGRFLPGDPFDLASNPGSAELGAVVAALDLDGDARPDLLVAGPQELRILLNLGGDRFAFGDPVQAAAIHYPQAYAVGDIDGDGHDEAVTVDNSGNLLAIRGPVPAVLATNLYWYSRPEIADLEGDGTPELLLHWNFGGPVQVFRQVTGQGLVPDGETVSLYRAVPADLDGDGDLDLVTLMTDSVHWARNDGTSFAPIEVLPGFPWQPSYSHPPLPFDVDDDGDLDLIDVEGSRIIFQTAPMQFTSVYIPPVEGFGRLADLDRDGRPDLLVAGYTQTQALLSSRGAFDAPGMAFGDDRNYYTARVAPLVAGGPLHVIAVGYQPQWPLAAIDVLAPSGGALVQVGSTPHSAYLGNYLLHGSPVVVQDFDGDGITDILLTGPSFSVVLRRGDGAGGFGPGTEIGQVGQIVGAGVGDLDGDGDPDVVDVFSARIALNDGTGGFTVLPGPTFLPFLLYGGPVDARRYRIGDVNGDGLADIRLLVARGGSPGLISFGQGGSLPSFTPVIPIAPIVIPDTFDQWDLLDIDRDGHDDYLNFGRGVWRRNDGTGLAPGAEMPLPAGVIQGTGLVADLDGDGQRDEVLFRGATGFHVFSVPPEGGFAEIAPVFDGPAFGLCEPIPSLASGGGDDLLLIAQGRITILKNLGPSAPGGTSALLGR